MTAALALQNAKKLGKQADRQILTQLLTQSKKCRLGFRSDARRVVPSNNSRVHRVYFYERRILLLGLVGQHAP